ncbi:histidine kinase [Pelomonas sp. CA6]|uniref:sensor histidine kinase n=1 Tax=Pelomonas sp. CA6 TaxID=2907999 RepID=UPI001F4AFAB2|nr:histidine kinase [Pelomonas sp. CA6]MCH7341831.1 histidine kinase [Pelomonas sp. CA6]
MSNNTPLVRPQSDRRLWLSYAGACLLSWMLYAMAGAELQRGLWQLWEAAYQATLSLAPPMLLGPLLWWLVRALQGRPMALQLAAHLLGALGFALAWQGLEFALAWWLFGPEHARAMLMQTVLWRAIWGLFVYSALVGGFTAVLKTRQARASALAAAQAESALARAELAAISGKLNPHFLFNTLNSLIALTRRDPRAAEAALMQFATMMRYVLDAKRNAEGRASLAEEVDFLHDYLALESLRLGARLRVQWDLEPGTLDDEIPVLTLQPLVENSILHAIAPRVEGGCVSISARRDSLNGGLALTVADDGPGCAPDQLDGPSVNGRGVGLSALRRRFALDFDGRARLRIHTAPGAGFRVDLWIPQT